VLRRPAISAALSVALLATLALPALQIHTASSALNTLPRSTPTVEALNRIQTAFPGQASPAVIAVKTNTASPAYAVAVAHLQSAAAATHQGYGAVTVDTNPSHTVGRIAIPLPGNGTDAASNRALLTLRGQLLPATIGKLAGVSYGVTG
jgi:putative drug exporter of the RND superfamily